MSAEGPELSIRTSARLSFGLLRTCAGVYLVFVFYHNFQLEPLQCVLIEDCKNERLWRNPTELAIWRMLWVAASAGAVLLIFVKGMLRRTIAALLLVSWVLHLARVSLTPPHISFVSLFLLHLAASSTRRDSNAALASDAGARIVPSLLLLVHRTALAAANAGSGIAKLFHTPGWRQGIVFEGIATAEVFRYIEWSSMTGLLTAASPLMCAVTITIECGAPLLDLLSELLPERAAWRMRLAGWLASVALQCGILLLMRLTDVSLGMLIFHIALLDSAIDVHAASCAHADGSLLSAESDDNALLPSAAPPSSPAPPPQLPISTHTPHRAVNLSLWPVPAVLVVSSFLARPLTCLVATDEDDLHWPLTSFGAMNLPTDLTEALVKAFLPLPKTSWDSWPCLGGDPTAIYPEPMDPGFAKEPIFLYSDDLKCTRGVAITGNCTQYASITVGELQHAGSEPLGGGHFWHAGIGNAGLLEMALMLCDCSPLHPHTLAARYRDALGVRLPAGRTLTWFFMANRTSAWYGDPDAKERRVRCGVFCAQLKARHAKARRANKAPQSHRVSHNNSTQTTLPATARNKSAEGALGHHARLAPTPVGGDKNAERQKEKEVRRRAAPPVHFPCKPYCRGEACSELKGDDLESECGGCDEGHMCRPGANGFRHRSSREHAREHARE